MPRDVIAVPQSSVLYDSGQAYVFVVSPDAVPVAADERANRRNISFLPVEKIRELQEPGIYIAVMNPPGRFGWDFQVTYFYVTEIGGGKVLDTARRQHIEAYVRAAIRNLA